MTRSDLICYKNYYGSVHFDPQEELFFGKIEFIRDLVNYEASEAKSLIKAFHEAVDSYLEDCNNLKRLLINHLRVVLMLELILNYIKK